MQPPNIQRVAKNEMSNRVSMHAVRQTVTRNTFGLCRMMLAIDARTCALRGIRIITTKTGPTEWQLAMRWFAQPSLIRIHSFQMEHYV